MDIGLSRRNTWPTVAGQNERRRQALLARRGN